MSLELSGGRRAWIPVVLSICLALTGCQKPTVGMLGAPVHEKAAPVAVTLVGYGLQRVEIEGDAGPLIYPEPVLALRLKFENRGEKPFPYQPAHVGDKATNLQSPLLFLNPGPKKPPSHNISGVFLESGRLGSQQEKLVQIPVGESLEDVYLFTEPSDENAELLLTIPPVLHGGKNFLHIRVSYTRPDPPVVKVYSVGEEIDLGGAKLKVTGGTLEYLTLKDSIQGDGYSKDPVFKVVYTVTNSGERPMAYDPGHVRLGQTLGPTLHEVGGSGKFLRVRFGGDREVPGQIGAAMTVDPGGSLPDFAVFERPPKQVTGVQFRIPGRLFGNRGMVRVDMPYAWSDPKRPAPPEPAPEP